MMIKLLFSLSVLCVFATGQRITTIHLDGVQYYVSRMNPYSPELNYYLAYQYCRSLGLQLASFDTKEKYESITRYLTNAKFNQYDYWTSGNRLGTGMFLWMSTGLPFNSTFDFFESDDGNHQNIDPLDHNGNTSPQRTARDDTRKPLADNNCVLLQAPELKWAPDDCLQVKDFICEQTRCYYYNYGSIPVSSTQGRPITTTTTTEPPMSIKDTTALYVSLMSSTKSPLKGLPIEDIEDEEHEEPEAAEHENNEEHSEETTTEAHYEDESEEESTHTANVDDLEGHTELTFLDEHGNHEISEEESPIEQKLRQLTENIENLGTPDNIASNDDETRQSFLSLSDLIKTLRPDDKKQPLQIDSHYSSSRVLGENQKPDIVYHPRNTGDVANRSLFKK